MPIRNGYGVINAPSGASWIRLRGTLGVLDPEIGLVYRWGVMKQGGWRGHSEWIVASAAIFVSLSTLVVYIYQARIMQQQQHVSVWPYVEWATGNLDGFSMMVKNKGIGPAIVQRVERTLDGQPIETNRQLLEAVMGPDTKIRLINSGLEGRVLSPGEEVLVLRIPDLTEAREFQAKFRARKFAMNITYSSVYGDTWVSTGFQAKPVGKRH